MVVIYQSVTLLPKGSDNHTKKIYEVPRSLIH